MVDQLGFDRLESPRETWELDVWRVHRPARSVPYDHAAATEAITRRANSDYTGGSG